MALKEIRLEHEEGAPCTAIREGTMSESAPWGLWDEGLSNLHPMGAWVEDHCWPQERIVGGTSGPGDPSGPVSPVSLLKDLKHANIVTLHDLIHTERSLTLVFEYLVSWSGAGSPSLVVGEVGEGREGMREWDG